MSEVHASGPELTPTESGLLREFAAGATPAEVADGRSISQEDLETALRSILTKLRRAALGCVLDDVERVEEPALTAR